MPDTDDIAKLQEQIFELVRKSQETMVDAGRAFTDRVSAMAPTDTAALDEMIDNAFDMTEKVLESQREFAKRVIEAVTSQLPGVDRGTGE